MGKKKVYPLSTSPANKNVKVDDFTFKKLQNIKYSNSYATISDVIKDLINNVKL